MTRTRTITLILIVIVVAAGFRFIRLDYAPSGGHGDVSWIGINALDWVDRGIWQFYIRELYSPEFFPVYLTGLLIKPVGIAYMPQRIITAVAGVLFVALLYPAAYWLIGDERPRAFRIRAGLFAVRAGAVSLHVVAINRLGMESPPFLTVVTLMTALTAWAWRRGGWGRWRARRLLSPCCCPRSHAESWRLRLGIRREAADARRDRSLFNR
jgi:prepilin signal peptidase PulO-like enzyme (type II secretory pathway)